MLVFTERVLSAPRISGELRLAYEWRQKSRCRVTVAAGERAGEDVGLSLQRGTVLRDGELVSTGDGVVLRVTAAIEQLLQVTAATPLVLARIAYHLGNRHVPVQVGADEFCGWLRLQLDHVLESMVVGLDGRVTIVSAPFDPETGAYGHGNPDHGHRSAEGGDGHSLESVAGRHDDRRHAPKIHDFLPGRR
jgi:urease accessory protein